MIPSLESAVRLYSSGYFAQALSALSHPTAVRSADADVEVLRAELFERTGRYSESASLANRLLNARGTSKAHQSRCETVLGLIAWSTGHPDEAAAHLGKAAYKAQAAEDLHRLCWAQLRLMLVMADRQGIGGAMTAFTAARLSVTRLGDPIVTAALHIFVGEIDAKRGIHKSSRDHTSLGQTLLQRSPNVWLDGVAENNHTALAIMASDFEEGLLHASRAHQLSAECGAAAMHRAALTNLANLYRLKGNFSRASEYLEQAANIPPNVGQVASGGLDSQAGMFLLQGQLSEAKRCLSEISARITSDSDAILYANRHSRITLADICIAEGDWETAERVVFEIKALAERSGDRPLRVASLIREAEVMASTGRASECCSTIRQIEMCNVPLPGDLRGRYECGLGSISTRLGMRAQAHVHFGRAKRIFAGLQSQFGQLEVERTERLTSLHGFVTPDQILPAGELLQSASAILAQTGNPETVATELTFLLQHAACVAGAVAIARDPRGQEQRLATFGTLPAGPHVRSFGLGSARQLEFEVRVQPLDDVESQATLNAVSLLLETVRELERAREEREARLTLWPLEQLPSGNDSIVMGTMEELLSQARRIAQTNVVVLITGESGTGKEVVARAIHAFSSRARKAFVPFNCAAIARDLAESQLFGHRRGAFTGADRDVPGLVRSAKDGTLFLDEVGEMALELQPKLLRFLESGEINPLGESSPFNVDVRIIAATNADLDTLVEQGKFREDLFYRLNVVRVTIPPLRERRDEIPALVHHFVAKAAVEFGKERVRVAEETMEQLLLYPWPGNVRQLQNELRRIVALADNYSVLQPASLSKAIRQEPHAEAPANSPDLNVTFSDKLGPTISRIEREMIKAALSANQGKLEAAAKALGISRKGLYLKRQRLGV